MKPIIKWMGGKSKILTHLKKNGWNPQNRILEPFCGSAAVSLDSGLSFAINDANQYLINYYQVVASLTDEEIHGFISDFINHKFTKEEYVEYRDRQYEITLPYDLAKWFFYINRVGFNGLWRVNKNGKNNVAFGKPMESWSAFKNITFDNFRELRDILKGQQITCQDGAKFLIENASKGDWVFVDPPYDNAEDKYTEEGWSRKKLVSLKEAMLEVKERGCTIVHTNANTDFVKELFADRNKIEIGRMGGMNSDPSKRQKVRELFIMI